MKVCTYGYASNTDGKCNNNMAKEYFYLMLKTSSDNIILYCKNVLSWSIPINCSNGKVGLY